MDDACAYVADWAWAVGLGLSCESCGVLKRSVRPIYWNVLVRGHCGLMWEGFGLVSRGVLEGECVLCSVRRN